MEMKEKPKTIFIFGAGEAGRSAARRLETEFQLLGFVDNDAKKNGSWLGEYKVYEPGILRSREPDHIFIASEFSEQILEQLRTVFDISPRKITVLDSSEIKDFQFSEHLDHQPKIKEMLSDIHSLLEQRSVRPICFSGTLLGLYRDHGFIPWDTDIDLAISESSLACFEENAGDLVKLLELASGTPWDLVPLYCDSKFGPCLEGSVRGFQVKERVKTSKYPTIDVFVIYFDSCQAYYTLSSRGISLKKRYFIETEIVSLADCFVRVPKNVEGYLEDHYGSDWRVPTKSWNLSMLSSVSHIK